MRSFICVALVLVASAKAYWLMGIEDFITTERMDPVVSPGKISGHVHSVLGGSNFRFNTTTAALRQSECTSIPIPEDKSNYWFPQLYFQWGNGSFTSLNGGAVIYYLFNDNPGTTTAFPDDFRMLSGDPTLRTYDPTSYAQQAVTFLCLDFNGVSTRHNELPAKACPSGIRAQINFPSCWDGKNLDSSDHKSHVAFLSGGPDSGTCSDPKYPVTLPRIFIEVYWASNDFEQMKPQAMNSSQPFVYAYGDPTGYGYHADFINGWDVGVLQKAVDNCHCNEYGDPTCCVQQGIFHMNQGQSCRITKSINEQTTGTLPKLPGNNPVQPAGQRATTFPDNTNPQLISPVYAYTGDTPTQVGAVVPGSGGSPAATTGILAPSVPPSVPSSSSISKPIPTTSASAHQSSVPASVPQPPATSSVPHQPASNPTPPQPGHSSVPAQSGSPSVPQQPVSSSVQTPPVPSSPGTSSQLILIPETSTAAQPAETEPAEDDEDCDDEPTSTHITHVSLPTSQAHPTETQSNNPEEPASTHGAPVPSTTSHAQPTGAQSDDSDDCDEEPISTSTAHVQSMTSFTHALPATTIKNPVFTVSIPSISIPSIPIPTFSMPHMPGTGNTPNGSGNTDVHMGTGSNSGSGSGSGSGLSTPHQDNNPVVHVPVPTSVPNGHDTTDNKPLPDCDDPVVLKPITTPKPRRCPSRRGKRSILAEKLNAPAPIEVVRDTTPAFIKPRSNHMHHSRRRFWKNLYRD